jgi:DNA-binding transcriptional regulator YdaS (Cro superfamily)
MRGRDLVAALRTRLRVGTEKELAKRLGVHVVALHQWRNARKLTPRQLTNMIAGLEKRIVTAQHLLAKLKSKLGVDSDLALARAIGVTAPTFHHWRNGDIPAKVIANAIASARAAGAQEAEDAAIRPIVEFYPLSAAISRGGAKQELFSTTQHGKAHPYRAGLQEELKQHHGVYVFFDSRGHALYAGKAKQQSLWKEMTSAFNRPRQVQRIKRVNHPERKVQYKNSNEKSRQISPVSLALHELAAYVSAYEVSPGLIGELESLLVRAFPNDLLNVRMERFDQQRAARPKPRRRKKPRRGRRRARSLTSTAARGLAPRRGLRYRG